MNFLKRLWHYFFSLPKAEEEIIVGEEVKILEFTKKSNLEEKNILSGLLGHDKRGSL